MNSAVSEISCTKLKYNTNICGYEENSLMKGVLGHMG